ncbi:MAG: DEAD/DEAH box helicase [Planctomycetaceae bacterium]
MNLRISVSPHGRLLCESTVDNPSNVDEVPSWTDEETGSLLAAFERSPSDGLMLLAQLSDSKPLSIEMSFWRNWARRCFQSACQMEEQDRADFTRPKPSKPILEFVLLPNQLELEVVLADAPPMRGLEYLTSQVLTSIWGELAECLRERAIETEGGLVPLLRALNPNWQVLGRVTFHLAENKRDSERPFAFLATYTHRMTAKSAVQHLPLAQALKQYAGERDQQKLAELLTPVRAAADRSTIVSEWLTSRALFQPHAISIDQAYRFLRDVPLMEECGLVVRVPNWWKSRKSSRPTVQVRLGEKAPSALGVNGLLDFNVSLSLDDGELTAAEIKQLLASTNGLQLLRGKWIEVNREQLKEALDHWKQLQKFHANGVDFLQGMRLLAGASLQGEGTEESVNNWTRVTAGNWLHESLAHMRNPSGVKGCRPGTGLNATLRPYQADGVRWLWFMTRLQLGACLADDMGLGKTIQVIDLLLRLDADIRDQQLSRQGPSLLVVPASLLGNWKQELERFAPQLKVLFAHRSETEAAVLNQIAKNPETAMENLDLVVTTYSMVNKVEWTSEVSWQLVVLDEAQAIKNAGSAQTKSVKKLRSTCRIVLTGTPVENRLGDLWSLFDFCCPGLLGTTKQFKESVNRQNKNEHQNPYGAIRRLVQPYILRRLKTDPTIVPDLPDKTEIRVECGLSRQQAAFYQQVVDELARQLKEMKENKTEGIQRRGVVLATMMKLKQICNHPSQYLSSPAFEAEESGKLIRLMSICEPIIERQEKILVFTQFQSLCDPLANFLTDAYGRTGLVLHGGVPVAKRKELVRQFQDDDTISYFVISVKAGGTGLNLTAASHVVHFDRWWNPAVENQATDRAYRIGQKRNVLVHKFVCRGTIEERIDQMIREKQELADEILGQTNAGETLLTEMSDQELLKFVALDITQSEEL